MPPKLILFLALICPLFGIAQANYKEGYVITNAGDTMKGFINYREWNNNPSLILFRQSTDNPDMDITPANTQEVVITGFETYERFEVSLSLNPVNFDQLTDTATKLTETKTVFLKEIVSGDHVDLYSYTDKLKTRFYILSKGKNTPEELIYIKKLNDMQVETENIFKTQLMQVAKDVGTSTPALENKIVSSEYSEGSLTNVVGRINTNNESTTGTKGKSKARNISHFAGIGIIQAKISYTGNDLITANGLDGSDNTAYKNVSTTNLSPVIAFGINFYSTELVHRLSVKAEISAYSFASSTTSYTRFPGTTAEDHYTFHLNGWSITVAPQAIVKLYGSKSLKAYVGAGFGINVLATSKNSIYKVGINQPLTYNETTNNYLPLNRVNLLLNGRAGILLNRKIDLYIYGSIPSQYNSSNPEDFSVKSGVLAFCAAYNF